MPCYQHKCEKAALASGKANFKAKSNKKGGISYKGIRTDVSKIHNIPIYLCSENQSLQVGGSEIDRINEENMFMMALTVIYH